MLAKACRIDKLFLQHKTPAVSGNTACQKPSFMGTKINIISPNPRGCIARREKCKKHMLTSIVKWRPINGMPSGGGKT